MRTAVAVTILGALCLCAPAMAQQKTIRLGETTPRDLQLAEALRTRVSLEYEVPTELSEIIEFINEVIAQQTKVRHALRLDPKAVELNPRNVQITMDNVRVERALRLLLTDATTQDEEQANNELSYVAWSDAGVIYITNRQRIQRLNRSRREFRFVDARDLLAQYPLGPGGSSRSTSGDDDDDTGDIFGSGTNSSDSSGTSGSRSAGLNQVIRLLVRMTGPENWGDVGLSQDQTDNGDTTTNNP